MDYKKKAIDCVKDTVLPIQRAQFEECGCDLDEQYTKRYYLSISTYQCSIITYYTNIFQVSYPMCLR